MRRAWWLEQWVARESEDAVAWVADGVVAVDVEEEAVAVSVAEREDWVLAAERGL